MSDRDETNNTTAMCYPSRPCNRWRTCNRCSRQRQGKVADAVADLESRVGRLRWHILYPMQPGQHAARAVREDWIRAAAPIGAIWTIEQSKKTNAIHINVITEAKIDLPPKNANHWNQKIEGDVRRVGAYIAKRSQMPSKEDYEGRLYGTAGQLWGIMANQKISKVVAAAATQYAIDSHSMINRAAELALSESEKNIRKWANEKKQDQQKNELTKEEFRNIASRWLPDLLEWREQHRARSTIEVRKQWVNNEEN